MKNIVNYGLCLILLLFFSACEDEFNELNTNEVNPTSIDPVFILNNAIVNASYPGATLIYDLGIVQQIVSPNSGVITGANYNQDNRNATEDLWIDNFRGVIKHTRDLISQVEDNPERSNLLHMARIIQSYSFIVLTDTYGDIPYNEGGKGFTDQIVFPAYDSQEDIYPAIIQELTDASAALDFSGPEEPGEVLYGGDISKWKKLGYTLLLRAGMRLTKVNPTAAQAAVQAALAGGIMESNADNFVIRHDDNYNNAIGNTLNGTEANNFFLVASFVDVLQSTNDPRLAAIAVRYEGAASGPEQTVDRANIDPAVQIGMPMGHDNNSIVGVASDLGLVSFYEFSQADRTRVVKRNAPMFLATYAQAQLLLAEAAERGWVSSGSAESFYNNGVRAHMEQMADYDPASTVSEGDITAYLTANPFDSANALEQVNNQYWIASFLNGPEAFANFRRSGFPALAPNPFPGQDISGDFIRRLTYPSSEIAVNTDNVNAAISRMGPDNLETRVWWDQ
ncbi:MAG: SusD/RagB family nutrient-binding outer membrane lipoprotein [Bacteroidota bacterium]